MAAHWIALAAALAASLSPGDGATLGPQTQAAVAGEDWEYSAAASGDSSVASIGYAGGVGVSVYCAADHLRVVIEGVGGVEDEILQASATRADGRVVTGRWQGQRDGGVSGLSAARWARLLRGGGRLAVRASRNDKPPLRLELDLPQNHHNLDRVIEACGRRLTEPRDMIPEMADLRSVPRPALDLPHRRGRTGPWPRVEISCIGTDDARLSQCQTEFETPVGRNYGAAVARAYEGARVDLVEPSGAAGRLLNIVVTMHP